MKKTYLAPTIRVVPLKMQSHILINSIDSMSIDSNSISTDDIGIIGNGTPFDLTENDIR